MFVFSPLASAIAATDTPGCRQAAMTCSLNSGLCRRLVLLGAAFTTIVSMCPPKIHGHYPPISSLSRWRGRTHTMIRHTTAMHLLQAGVDISVIALWLGHESPATTHQYVEADLTMKERALARLHEP